jgi:hypothetical protein
VASEACPTLASDFENKSLRIRLQVGSARREFQSLQIGELEKFPERVSKQWITIVDEIASSNHESILGIHEVARDLLHSFSIRAPGNPGNLNSAVLKSMMKSTKYRAKPVRVSTSTLKKSVAAIAPQ